MNKYIFTLAVGVSDRPGRWKSVAGYFSRLASVLTKLGHEVTFAINSEVSRRKDLKSFECYFVANHDEFGQLLAKGAFTHCFIWGGRLDEDRETKKIAEQNGISVIFSELGWFPQKGTIYFDGCGTNSEVSFNNQHYPACSEVDKKKLERYRKKFYRAKVGSGIFSKIDGFKIKSVDLSKPIFVPLQDETDTNITLASPFKTMGDFICCLANEYPEYHFVVRPHPSGEYKSLPEFKNVEYQDKSVDIYRAMPDFGLVVGINSTLLLEAAMMNMPVASFGTGVGTGTGVFYELDDKCLPRDLGAISIDSALAGAYILFLLENKQLYKKNLSSTVYVKNTYLAKMLDIE